MAGANEDRGENIFPCSTDHEQDCQPYPADPYSAESTDHTYIIHTYVYIHILSACLQLSDYQLSKRSKKLSRPTSAKKLAVFSYGSYRY